MPHRPWWKVCINTPLRLIQWRTGITQRPYLVASIFDGPALKGYRFQRVQMRHKAWHSPSA